MKLPKKLVHFLTACSAIMVPVTAAPLIKSAINTHQTGPFTTKAMKACASMMTQVEASGQVTQAGKADGLICGTYEKDGTKGMIFYPDDASNKTPDVVQIEVDGPNAAINISSTRISAKESAKLKIDSAGVELSSSSNGKTISHHSSAANPQDRQKFSEDTRAADINRINNARSLIGSLKL